MAELFWCEVKVEAKPEEFELIAELFQTAGSGGVVYDDPAILNSRTFEADEIVSEDLIKSIAEVAGVKAYFPVDDRLGERIESVKTRIEEVLDRRPQFWLRQIREDDWAHAWKAYFKPEKIGQVVIKPSWEAYQAAPGEVVVALDPGMAFGTGNHPTTRLCIELLQELVTGPLTMLDLGTGSGVLAVVGAKLGAAAVAASDIDPVAVRAARENVAANRVESIVRVKEADLLQGYGGEQYDLVVANIIADIIVRMVPEIPAVLKPQGILLASGIISERRADVEQALNAAGFAIKTVVERDNWVAVVAQQGRPVARQVQP